MNINELTIAQLKQVIAIKEKIAGLESQLASLIGSSPKTQPLAKKGGMSAAGRKAVAAAQKKRWAKIKAAAKASPAPAKTVVAVPAPKVLAKATAAKPAKKWKISAAGMAKIKATSKAYWAKRKAAELAAKKA